MCESGINGERENLKSVSDPDQRSRFRPTFARKFTQTEDLSQLYSVPRYRSQDNVSLPPLTPKQMPITLSNTVKCTPKLALTLEILTDFSIFLFHVGILTFLFLFTFRFQRCFKQTV